MFFHSAGAHLVLIQHCSSSIARIEVRKGGGRMCQFSTFLFQFYYLLLRAPLQANYRSRGLVLKAGERKREVGVEVVGIMTGTG